MRCSCKACGTYMVQHEQGLESGCICPECFSKCNACMGTEQPPVSAASLTNEALLRARLREIEAEMEQEED
ncbi:MAG: hypothetical protein PHO41_03400 [Eubacteriales bacterium]|nr:hypothetical protein [Eubacteriales bacterium]